MVADPATGGGWWYVFPDGKAHGPFKRGQIATRWRREKARNLGAEAVDRHGDALRRLADA